MQNKPILSIKNLSCYHFSKEDQKELFSFSVSQDDAQGLVLYLQNMVEHEENNNLARTYIIRDNISNEIAGYFSLRAGFIPWRILHSKNFDSLPGVELAAIAINETFRQKSGTKGLGSLIFKEFVLPIARQAAELIGIKTLYLFALPYDNLIEHYKNWGFVRLQPRQENFIHRHIKPKFDFQCIFMYQNLFKTNN